MMLSSILMLILGIIIYNIFSEVNSAGVPYGNYFTKVSLLNENNATPHKTAFEYLNNFDYKFEILNQIINKMDISLQSLQEKSHTWVIFQHHINSWNEGIRNLENKLDLLKRTHEEHHQQLQKLELAMASNNKINERYELILNDVRKFLISERKNKNEISIKVNNILRHIQLASIGNNERKLGKKANIMAPVGIPQLPQQNFYENITNKIEKRINTLSQHMALQKDLKQLNSLEKRNSKSLEHMNQVLSNQLDKYDEITTRLQKSNECCYSVSGELTTFTESSDILLKRIEKLVRNVSDKLNDIEVIRNSSERKHVNADIDHDSDETENEEKFSNEDLDGVGEQIDLEQNKNVIHIADIEKSVTEKLEYDDSHDVEFVRPMLNGCHELLYELTDVDVNDDSLRIDGIYKFEKPDLNEDERDFNERYCVFTKSPNDTGSPWTVIQRRGPYLQQENFNRSWSEYRNGFGHLSRDFWFGNEFIHRLVYHDDYELRIELEDFDGTQKWAEYAVFRIDSEIYNYNLLIGGYRGTIEDAMNYHNDHDFSTYDKRNDKTVDACCPCAMGYASGWWFDNCSEANLNGIYHYNPLGHNYIGIIWELWRGDYSLKKSRMMIRPRISTIHDAVVTSQDYHEYVEDP